MALHDCLCKKGFTIYSGKAGSICTFRLANKGAMNKKDITAFLRVLAAALARIGVSE